MTVHLNLAATGVPAMIVLGALTVNAPLTGKEQLANLVSQT